MMFTLGFLQTKLVSKLSITRRLKCFLHPKLNARGEVVWFGMMYLGTVFFKHLGKHIIPKSARKVPTIFFSF